MRKFRKKLNSLLALALCILLLGTASVFAAGDCSLRVVIKDSAGDPVANINVELLQVALGEGGSCTLTPEFADLGLSAQELLADPGTENADLVYQYRSVQELFGQVKHTSDKGEVGFTALEKGIYLVFERGEQAVSFQPYLVVLPVEIEGNLESNVISIPKVSETDTKTLLTVKLWEDDMNAHGIRPVQIQVTVLCDGTPIKRAMLSEATNWEHIFYMLPADGEYTVEESPVLGYQAEYTPVAEGYVITNSYVGIPGGGGGGEPGPGPGPVPAHVSVRKIWNDENDAAGKRPASITVQLIEDGTVTQTASLSAANYWAYTFTELDPLKSYTVQEITVADYAASYSGNAASGITIINTYTGETDPGTPPPPVVPEPELIDIPVRVDWIDDNDAAGKRPETVTVHLITDGGIIASTVLRPDGNSNRPIENSRPFGDASGEAAAQSANSSSQTYPDNSWEGFFSGVPADLSYTVWQPGVEDYSTTYSGNAASGFVVTNTYTEGTTDPGVPPDPSFPVDPPEPVDPPDKPVGPSIPQTGAEVLPIYLLMVAGVLLVLLGIIDLARGRKKNES